MTSGNLFLNAGITCCEPGIDSLIYFLIAPTVVNSVLEFCLELFIENPFSTSFANVLSLPQFYCNLTYDVNSNGIIQMSILIVCTGMVTI
jgi:hypothetical protein